MKTDAILFDLDGTLWDSVAGVSVAWQSVVAEMPQMRPPVTDREILECMGLDMDEFGQRIFPMLPLEERRALVARCVEAEHTHLRRHGGRLYPGVEKSLAFLSEKYPLAIVSNCQSGYIECFFEITGLRRYFTAWECFGNTGKKKGENIIAVVEKLHCKHPVYVGDMIKDQLAADLAGIPFVFADYGFGIDDRAPQHWDERISSFSLLTELFSSE